MSPKDKALAQMGFGLCALVLAAYELFDASKQRPTGRWALIFGPLHDAFGYAGPAFVYAAFGVCLMVVGFINVRKK